MPSIWLFVLLILRLAWKKKGWQMGFAVEWGLLLTCIANAYLSAAFHLEYLRCAFLLLDFLRR